MNFKLSRDIKLIIALFAIWRLATFFVAFIAIRFIPFKGSFPYYQERLISSGLPHFIWSFGNFDGVHYLGIAKDAYAYQYTQAFFPLYPILIKLFSYFTFKSYLLSGLIVSNTAFLFSLIVFYKLTLKVSERKVALWAIIFLLSFPTSFYFGAVYTESIFLLMIVSSFYLIEKNKVLLASLLGSFASATRLVGLFLIPSISFFKNKINLLPVFIVPLGFLFYVFYLKVEFNNALYFLTSQSIFGQERSTNSIVLLPQVFWRYIKILSTTHGVVFFNALLEMLFTIFALLVLTFSYKKVRAQWLIFSFLAVITPTLTGTFASMPRYVAIAFPVYIFLASINSRAVKLLILITFLSLLLVLTAMFSQGYWVA